MAQRAIPYHYMRGGTSKGPYFNAADLPDGRDALAKILVSVIGAGNARNIDGIGGGNAVTTKVAILSPSEDPDADIDYFFAQVAVDEPNVDFSPTCGNILVGVGPAAIEKGLIAPQGDTTKVRIRAVNTGALVEAIVQTPGGAVNYAGNVEIAGVPGSAAPVALNFLDVVGSRCGALLPTGNAMDEINGIQVSLVDVAMPMMIARAADFGLRGDESEAELRAKSELYVAMEPIRLEAGKRMGLGDVTKSVVPKIGLLSEGQGDTHLTVRYFMPWDIHPSLAVTGSQCLAACALLPDSVAEGLTKSIAPAPATITFAHPSGTMDVTVDYALEDGRLDFRSAGLVRTARLIARGEVMLPDHLAG